MPSSIQNTPTPSSDPSALVGYLTQHHDQLLAYIYSLILNWQDSQDVLQKTSLVLWRKFDQFDPESQFMDWASRVAFYESKNFLRMAGRDRHCFNDELLNRIADERLNDVSQTQPRIVALRKCVEKLSEDDRELLGRVYDDRDSIDQISKESGRAVQTLYNRLYKIRQQLLGCIERNLQREEEALS